MATLQWYQARAIAPHKGVPFLPEREARVEELDAVRERLLLTSSSFLPASKGDLLRAHSQGYIDHIEALSDLTGWSSLMANIRSPFLSSRTTVVGRHTYFAVCRAAGAAVMAAHKAYQDRSLRAFCAVRPPGHHAGRSLGEGFCLVNNVAVAALAVHASGARVAIIDFDRHHGNGTEEIIARADSDRLMFLSSYQEGCDYAKREEPDPGSTASFTYRFPIGKGKRGPDVCEYYKQVILPEVNRFEPDLLLISAGFDLHVRDPLLGLKVKMTTEDYGALTRLIVDTAKKSNAGIVSVLEGGYNVSALAECVEAHVRALQE